MYNEIKFEIKKYYNRKKKKRKLKTKSHFILLLILTFLDEIKKYADSALIQKNTNFNKTNKKPLNVENNLFNTPQMGRKKKKSSDITDKRKNSSQIMNTYKDIVLDTSNNNNFLINQNMKPRTFPSQSNTKSLFNDNQTDIKKLKNSNKNLNKIEFNSKNIAVDLNKEKETISESIKLMRKNTILVPNCKKDIYFNAKDDLSKYNRFKSSLNLRKHKSFKEDPEFVYNRPFKIKLSSKYNSFAEYEEVNTSQINNCNFYEYTEDCFKITSKLDKNITIEGYKSLDKIRVDKNIETKLNGSNYKLALFDLNETLLHYSLDNVEDFEHILSFEINCKDNEKINNTVGLNVRPYLLDCLRELSKCYIIGLYTSTERELAEKLIEFIDPNDQIFQIKLFRENCIKVNNPIFEAVQNNINQNGNYSNNNIKLNKNSSPLLKEFLYIKDLRIIENISLEKTIIIDNSVLSFCLQLENGIPIFPFYNDRTDSELRMLVNYLNHLSTVNDVRVENKNVIKLDSLYKIVPLLQDYSSSSSIEVNGSEFFYDSENANNISNFQFKKNSSSKNCIAINSADNFDYSFLSNQNNISKVTNNNLCNMTHVTFNANISSNNNNHTLNNSLNSFGNEIKIGSPIIRAKGDMGYQVLFVKNTEEDLNENSNTNKNIKINTLSSDSNSSQSKINSLNHNNNYIFNSENNKEKNELKSSTANSGISTVCGSNSNVENKKDLMDTNWLYCCNHLNNLNIFNSSNNNGYNNNFCDLPAGKLKISNFEFVNINNLNCESKDFSSQSPTNYGNKSNFETNFSFAGSGKKGLCSSKSFISNKSNISNKSILQDKLFVCLEEFHSKYTHFFKNNHAMSQNYNNYD